MCECAAGAICLDPVNDIKRFLITLPSAKYQSIHHPGQGPRDPDILA